MNEVVGSVLILRQVVLGPVKAVNYLASRISPVGRAGLTRAFGQNLTVVI